jgi:aspartate/glutamate racemase
MVDLLEKIIDLPGTDKGNWIVFGNSRLAYRPDELDLMDGKKTTTERRREATALHTIEVMRFLGCGAVGLACNSAHEVFRKVLETRPLPFVDMIRHTARSISHAPGRVLVMGVTSLIQAGLYQDALKECGLTAVVPSADNQARIMRAIYDTSFGLKTGQISRESETLLCRVMTAECQRHGCSHVVLGCTEIPLVFTPQACSRLRKEQRIPIDIEIIDGSAVLARALASARFTPSTREVKAPSPGKNTDWFPPAAFHVDSLTEAVSIQRSIFRLTNAFYQDQGRIVEGSYMHLPTLFLVGSLSASVAKLADLQVPLRPHGQQLAASVLPLLAKHLDSMR